MSELNASVDDFFLFLLSWMVKWNKCVCVCVYILEMCKYHYFGTYSVHNKLHFPNWMWRKQKEIIPKCDFRIDSTFVVLNMNEFQIHHLVAKWWWLPLYHTLSPHTTYSLTLLHTLTISYSPLDFSYLSYGLRVCDLSNQVASRMVTCRATLYSYWKFVFIVQSRIR